MTVDWKQLVSEYGPMVFGAAMRILGNAADAEDVVQETFLEAQQLSRRTTVASWSGLLRRMATCRAIDTLRRRKVTEIVEEQQVVASTSTPLEQLAGKELAAQLREALSELPPRQSAVFCLRYFEDLEYREIAESLSINTNAVGVALHKARAKLQVLMADLRPDSETV